MLLDLGNHVSSDLCDYTEFKWHSVLVITGRELFLKGVIGRGRDVIKMLLLLEDKLSMCQQQFDCAWQAFNISGNWLWHCSWENIQKWLLSRWVATELFSNSCTVDNIWCRHWSFIQRVAEKVIFLGHLQWLGGAHLIGGTVTGPQQFIDCIRGIFGHVSNRQHHFVPEIKIAWQM